MQRGGTPGEEPRGAPRSGCQGRPRLRRSAQETSSPEGKTADDAAIQGRNSGTDFSCRSCQHFGEEDNCPEGPSMSRLIHNNDRLIDLLDQFAMSYRQGSLDEVLLASINERLSRTTDPREFHLIAEKLWSNIAPWYDIPTMIRILRRWLEIEPNSNEAKGTLGTI